MAEYVKSAEDWLREESDREDPQLVTSITNLVNRIKKENPNAEFKVHKIASSLTKNRTLKGSVAPHGAVQDHPA